jgi:hypothetical protein
MEKEFVPYGLAVKLKALGFDEPCFAFYQIEYAQSMPTMVDDDEQYRLTGFRTCKNSEIPEHYISAPTFSQAFRWFREKYGLYSWVKLHNGYVNDSFYEKLPITWTVMEHESGKQHYEKDADNYLYYTHEEAELACLTKLIEIVESKSE